MHDNEVYGIFYRFMTKKERVISGLSTGHDAPLIVREGGIAGRGVFAEAAISKGSWLCEYKATKIYPPSEKPTYEEMYALNNEGCYIVESAYAVPNVGKLCWDATRCYNQIGRYMNHAQHSNAEMTQPVYVRGKWRIGFTAIRDIEAGDEVVWDYKIRDEEWTACRLVGGVVRKESLQIESTPSMDPEQAGK